MRRLFKRRFFLILLAVLLLTVPVTAFAQIWDSGPPSPPQGEITEIPDDYLKPGLGLRRPATLFPVGSASSDIAAVLPDGITGIIGASGAQVPCDVVWTVADTSAPGWTTAEGVLSPPPGCTIAPGMEIITFPVMLYEDDMQPVEPLQKLVLFNARLETYLAELLPPDSDLSSLAFPSHSAIAVCANGQYYSVPVNWDLSSVNTAKPGAYPVVGYPVLPPCFTLPDDFPGFSATVFIGDPSAIDLSFVTEKSNVSLTCEWLTPLSDPANARLYYSLVSPEGPFIKDDVKNIGIIAGGTQVRTNYSWYTKNKLGIDAAKLENEKDYYFYLEYDGKRSNVLSVRTSKQNLPKTEGIGGDRDGGDRNPPPAATPAPPVSGTAPQPSASPSSGAVANNSAEQNNEATTPAASASPVPAAYQAAAAQNAAPLPQRYQAENDNQAAAPSASSPGDFVVANGTHQEARVSETADEASAPGAASLTRPFVFPVWLIVLFAAAAVLLIVWMYRRFKPHGS